MIEFASLTMPKADLVEFHRALLARYIVESALRREQGLEPIDRPNVLDRMENVLDISPEESRRITHQMEDELWAYIWYSYTDEWAWYRAKRDAKKKLGDQAMHLNRHAWDREIEKFYDDRFNEYVSEIDMLHEAKAKKKKQNKKIK